MRYLFGFICVLGLVPLVGCGSEAASLCEGVECEDDDNECTDGVCDPATGRCQHLTVEDDTACDFGGLPGLCQAGVCVDAMLCQGVVCEDDSNECTSDECDPATGTCDHPLVEDGTGCAGGICREGVCGPLCIANVCHCSEAGIRAAIEAGGKDPYTFDCNGPTTVMTEAEIEIDNDVILDGEGNLTVDGNADHPLLFIIQGVTAQLHGLTITNGLLRPALINLGTLTLTHSKVIGNRSNAGGGISNEGTLTIANSEVSGNEGPQGAGIHNLRRGTLVLRNSTVSDNTNISPFTGGGIYNDGVLEMTGSTVSGNVADDNGGIYTGHYATSILINSTVSGNVSERTLRGGGILNQGTLVLINSTVSGNTPPYVESGSGSITMGGTVFGDGCTYSGVGGSPGSATSLGYNIESPGDTCGFDPDGTDLVNVTEGELNLGPLQDNDGPTETHALLPGSVAIDQIPAVDCGVTTDQRDEPRPVGDGCDVGSFERQPDDPEP